jgi:uridylate kinase
MKRRPKVAINTGGSIVAPDVLDPEFVKGLASVLIEVAQDRDLIIVVGGGRLARRYITACRELGADEAYLDWVGIDSTRLNARLLVAALGGEAYHGVPATLHEALDAMRDFPMVVMGGTHPGHTTDAVCAMVAELSKAEELVILTNVNGVYTADPRMDPDAERLSHITTSQLMEIVGGGPSMAGSNAVVDPLAARIIHRAAIKAKVVDGRDLEQVGRALRGEEFDGTVVTPDGGH